MKDKKKKWLKPRHKIIRNIAYCIMYPYSKLKYGVIIEKYKDQGDRAYLILFNHTTAFDQFFVGMAFKGAVYYLATEDIFSNGFISSILRYVVAPIPIKKQATDVAAVMNCLRVAREGGTIALAPEGNRTYSGKTGYMNPAIAALAKKIGLPILLYRIEGGYGVHPRWSDRVRRGKMRCYVSRVIEPEEYKEMSNQELVSQIHDGLYVDEAVADGIYRDGRRAEYLERALYYCPFCKLSKLWSDKNTVRCNKCQREVEYLEDKSLKGIGFDFPYRFVADWYKAQESFVSHLDLSQYLDEELFVDTVDFYEVIANKNKNLIKSGAKISLFGDRIVVNTGDEEKILSFDSLSAAAVLGRNKLNLYIDKTIYQIKGDKRFNALKYVNMYYRSKNIQKEEQDEQFLGL